MAEARHGVDLCYARTGHRATRPSRCESRLSLGFARKLSESVWGTARFPERKLHCALLLLIQSLQLRIQHFCRVARPYLGARRNGGTCMHGSGFYKISENIFAYYGTSFHLQIGLRPAVRMRQDIGQSHGYIIGYCRGRIKASSDPALSRGGDPYCGLHPPFRPIRHGGARLLHCKALHTGESVHTFRVISL